MKSNQKSKKEVAVKAGQVLYVLLTVITASARGPLSIRKPVKEQSEQVKEEAINLVRREVKGVVGITFRGYEVA